MPHVILPMCNHQENKWVARTCDVRETLDARTTLGQDSLFVNVTQDLWATDTIVNLLVSPVTLTFDLRTHPRYYEEQTPCQILAS